MKMIKEENGYGLLFDMVADHWYDGSYHYSGYVFIEKSDEDDLQHIAETIAEQYFGKAPYRWDEIKVYFHIILDKKDNIIEKQVK